MSQSVYAKDRSFPPSRMPTSSTSSGQALASPRRNSRLRPEEKPSAIVRGCPRFEIAKRGAASAQQIKNNTQVPGYVEPRAAGATTLDSVIIYLTADEANNARGTINARISNPGYYQLLGRSCVDFADVVINSTGFVPSNDVTPNNAIKQIRAQQIMQNTTQAP